MVIENGAVVTMAHPVGPHDSEVAAEKAGSYAFVRELTNPQGYARVRFLCDPEDVTYLVHPESLEQHAPEVLIKSVQWEVA